MIRRVVGGVRHRWGHWKQRRRLRTLYRPLIRPGDLCFDVGANEGQWTRVFLDLGAKVIAIEPQPEVCQRFLHRLKAEVRCVAVGSAEGEATLHLARESSSVAHIGAHWQEGPFSYMSWDRKITVPVVTLDHLIERYGLPDVCKIDVEGYETEVLKGLSSPIPLISFELQASFLHLAHECFELIQNLGEYRANFMVGDSGVFFGQWGKLSDVLERIRTTAEENPLLVGDVFVRAESSHLAVGAQ